MNTPKKQKAIQAGDYGIEATEENAPRKTSDDRQKSHPKQTDGRKVLALWGTA